jgi:hypothetical protein
MIMDAKEKEFSKIYLMPPETGGSFKQLFATDQGSQKE